ncbi:hypothetical protein KXQ82_18045 [Mucilaginibacter sp. HMF5004]|uniref:hypothetical protein n=1 Tax=Mucilaginibacter rivuli TaxID=2857527 RepID=UPI001C5D5AE4|nr:hypothetical protein [Mucilaginibacter rivuli]MBW4891633.1 hypothetical protein [Mucilaginibacter rivuli]
MKNSTKWLASAFAAASLMFASNVKAQTTSADSKNVWRLGIGVEAGVPTGDLNNFSSFSLGGTARLQYDGQSNLSYTLTSGYYNVFAKKVGTITPSDLGIVPLKAGLKVYPTSNIYISGEVGAGFETNYAKNTKLIVSPGIGYAGNQGLDVGLRYENFSGQNNNYGFVGLRVAYGFKL